jgi:hypothetical protein
MAVCACSQMTSLFFFSLCMAFKSSCGSEYLFFQNYRDKILRIDAKFMEIYLDFFLFNFCTLGVARGIIFAFLLTLSHLELRF